MENGSGIDPSKPGKSTLHPKTKERHSAIVGSLDLAKTRNHPAQYDIQGADVIAATLFSLVLDRAEFLNLIMIEIDMGKRRFDREVRFQGAAQEIRQVAHASPPVRNLPIGHDGQGVGRGIVKEQVVEAIIPVKKRTRRLR